MWGTPASTTRARRWRSVAAVHRLEFDCFTEITGLLRRDAATWHCQTRPMRAYPGDLPLGDSKQHCRPDSSVIAPGWLCSLSALTGDRLGIVLLSTTSSFICTRTRHIDLSFFICLPSSSCGGGAAMECGDGASEPSEMSAASLRLL